MQQPKWDKYEAVILLDAYIEMLNSDAPRPRIIKRVSADLRRMATNKGIETDVIFRNENGISFQMQSMESAYNGRTVMKPATRLFSEIVALYKTNRSEYENLLKEARAMIEGKPNCKDSFSSWLAEAVPTAPINTTLASCEKIEQFCLKLKVLKAPLFETTDLETLNSVQKTVQKNKIFRIVNKKQLKQIDIAMFALIKFVRESNLEKVTEKSTFVHSSTSMQSEEPVVTKERQPMNDAPLLYLRTEQDKRLLAKYPLVYKRIYSTLFELFESNQGETSVVELYERINHVARCADIEDILDNVSWARCHDKKYIFSEEIVTRNIAVVNINTTPKMLGNDAVSHSCVQTISSDSFYKYLHDDLEMAETTCRSYVSAIGSAERFAKKHCFEHQYLLTPDWREAKATADSLFRDVVFIEYNDQQHNRFSAALKKLLLFLRSDAVDAATTDSTAVAHCATQPIADELYQGVLIENFQKGFRLNSPIEMRKFKRCYEQMNGKPLDEDDAEIEYKIGCCGILFEDRVFTPQTMLGDELRERLFTYIKNCFAEGKTALYYRALFNEFSEDFLDYYIYNADMLKAYLSFVLGEDYFFDRSYFAKDANVSADPVDEIRTCLKEYGAPMTYDVMFENLSHIPQEKIKQILAYNGEFISNGRGEYFHVSAVHFSDEEMDNIAEIIAAAIEEKQFLSGNELVAAIQSKYPYTYEKNSAFSVVGLRDAIKYHLSNNFSFSGNIISKLGSSLTMSDVFADYCRSRDSFMLDELNVLANELGTVIYFDPVYENSLRINHDWFVSKKRAHFLVTETDDALDRFCTGDYISIGKISGFSLFPNAGFPWNEYLLEHYTAMYSNKYELLHIGFNANKCVGVIVKKSAGFESFDDCIVDVLANSNITLKKQSALQYLCDEGYIARRIYTNIEELLIRATAQRNRKEAN